MAEPQHAAKPAWQAPGLLPVLAMAAFGPVVVLAAASTVDWTVTSRFNLLDAARNYTPTPLPTVGASDLHPPEVAPLLWSGPAFLVVAAVLGLVLAALLVRRGWQRRPRRRVQVAAQPPPPPIGGVSVEDQAAALRRGSTTALELLDEIADPQDAVIRSWLALEQAAVTSGAPRRPADSPTEFAGALLAGTGADRDAVTRLLHLYHRARFSSHPVGLAEVKQARECVLSLSRSLTGYESALRRSVGGSPNR